MEALLGCGDGRVSGDMGFEPQALPSPHPGNQPPQRSLARSLPLGVDCPESRAGLLGSNDRERVGVEVDDPPRDPQDFLLADGRDLLGKRAGGVGAQTVEGV